MLDTLPEIAEIAGDSARMAEELWISSTTENNQLLKKAQKDNISRLKEELCGGSASRLEKILIDRIILCHIHVNYAEALFIISIKSEGGLSAKRLDSHQRWLDRAQGRLVSAAKALAMVRKLALPDVLLNLAKNQVNIGTVSVEKEPVQQLRQLEAENDQED
jgi:hypothetical protein